MKKILLPLFVTAFVIGSSITMAAWAGQGGHGHHDKVLICHANGDGTYNAIIVSENGIGGHFFNNGTPKSGHEDDILIDDDEDTGCPEPSPSPTPTESPSPTPSETPTPTESPSPSPSESPSPSPSESPSPTPTETPTPTESPSPSPSETPTETPEETPEPTPSETPSGGGGGGSSGPTGGNGPIGPIVIYNYTPPIAMSTPIPAGGAGETPLCELPKKIENFDVSTGIVGDGKIMVTWRDDGVTIPNETVEIHYGVDENNLDLVAISSNDGSEQIINLTNGTHYWFAVQVINACGRGPISHLIDPLP